MVEPTSKTSAPTNNMNGMINEGDDGQREQE